METRDSIDERAADVLGRLAETTSRRGLLTRLGELALKLVGISVVVALPEERAYAQFTCCDPWRHCNLHARFCPTCCGSSQPFYGPNCPSCSGIYKGGAWSGCCYNAANCTTGYWIYYDCCVSSANKSAASNACTTGNWCGIDMPGCPSNWNAYCGGDEYVCTVMEYGGDAPCSSQSQCGCS